MLDLTWWQVFALVGSAAIAVFGGRLLGTWGHRTLYRRVLMTRSLADDRFVLRLEGPAVGLTMIALWHVLLCFGAYPTAALAFCRGLGNVALLVVIGWGAMRLIDTAVDSLSLRSRFIHNQRVSQALLPLARRATKTVIVTIVAVMIIDRMGFAVGPLLVLIAIIGAAIALASARPLENLIAAYALLGDHGIREGDAVRLDSGVTGVIELIGLYSTRIRVSEDAFVIVPNRKLADAQIERSLAGRHTTRVGAAVAPANVYTQTSPGGLS
jgi:small-conductance mechanosensitive channel